jgi:hypothetical protein
MNLTFIAAMAFGLFLAGITLTWMATATIPTVSSETLILKNDLGRHHWGMLPEAPR